MKKSFEKIIEKTIINEGYFSNNSQDKGGMTYMGISRKYWELWDGWNIIDSYLKLFENSSKESLLDIFKGDGKLIRLVKEFYYEQFLVKLKADYIISYRIIETMFDYAVNSGVYQSSKTMQKIVKCSTDGKIGPISIKHINDYIMSQGDVSLQYELFLEKIKHYNKIVDKDPSQSIFLFGWVSRSFYNMEDDINIEEMLNYYGNKNIIQLYKLILNGRLSKLNRSNVQLEEIKEIISIL